MARKNALLDVLGDAYVRGMARNVNALAEIAGKPFPDPRVYARGAEFVPGVGDAVGLGQDVRGYAENPSSLTPWAGLWSLAAMAPGVPRKQAIDLLTTGGGARTVKIGDATITYGVGPDTVELIDLAVPKAKRGKGSAKAAVQQFISEADAAGKSVKLFASPRDKATDAKRLIGFYESMGFRPTGDSIDWSGSPQMVRSPK